VRVQVVNLVTSCTSSTDILLRALLQSASIYIPQMAEIATRKLTTDVHS